MQNNKRFVIREKGEIRQGLCGVGGTYVPEWGDTSDRSNTPRTRKQCARMIRTVARSLAYIFIAEVRADAAEADAGPISIRYLTNEIAMDFEIDELEIDE